MDHDDARALSAIRDSLSAIRDLNYSGGVEARASIAELVHSALELADVVSGPGTPRVQVEQRVLATEAALLKARGAWQSSDGALWLLLLAAAGAIAFSWVVSLPQALRAHDGAVENLLTSFGLSAVLLAALAVGYRRPKLLAIGGCLIGAAFYGSSLFLSDLVTGHNVGTTIRVGAAGMVSLAVAGWWLRSGSGTGK